MMTTKYYFLKKWSYHAVGWVLLFGFFFSIASYFQPLLYALISAASDTVLLLMVYLVTIHILFPTFFINKRKYLITSIIFIILFTILYFLIDYYLIPRIHNSEFTKPPIAFLFFRMLMFTSLVFFIGTSSSLVAYNNRLIENEKLLIEQKLNTELKLLKAQINPHFIFNALNNIYSLTYTRANNAPDAVLKLSEMLRYVFYDCGKEHVLLISEIKYIENYIGFQQMKSDFSQNITLTTSLSSRSEKIAPMLFIPFIENAFKYSRVEEEGEVSVSIDIQSTKEEMKFSIINGFDVNSMPSSGNGMGIENVKQRLKILYPDQHVLKIMEREGKFEVELRIFA